MTVEKQISSQDESDHHSPVAVDLYFNEGRYYMKDNRGIFKGYSKDDMKGMLKMMNCCGLLETTDAGDEHCRGESGCLRIVCE